MTDVSGPGPPQIINATCTTDHTLSLQWKHPVIFNNSIDFYSIFYRHEDSFDNFKEITVNTTNDYIEQVYYFNQLYWSIFIL